MTIRSISGVAKRVNVLLEKYKSEINKEPNFQEFIKLFFSKILHDELISRDDKYLFHLVESYFRFVKQRPVGRPKMRIFTIGSKGSDHQKTTVIEILNDDMPFIVDSLTAEINRLGYNIDRIINKVICVERGPKGGLGKIHLDAVDELNISYESAVHFEISYISSKSGLSQLEKRLEYVLEVVRCAVEDWQATLNQLNRVKNEIKALNVKMHKDSASEALSFLQWAEDKAFIFLGYAEYDVIDKKDELIFQINDKTKLGIFKKSNPDDLLTIDKNFIKDYSYYEKNLIEIVKCQNKSLVHRPVHLDNIRIKKYDKNGKVIGEYRFFGLFTSIVFYEQAHKIPLIRTKISSVIQRSGFSLNGHDGKELVSILGSYPREELFQISEEELFDIAMGIVSLSGRSVAKIFVRYDFFNRFVSIICYIPKKSFSTDTVDKIQDLLSSEFNGELSAYYTQISDLPLARVHFVININSDINTGIDYNQIEKKISVIASLWQDKLLQKLKAKHGEEKAFTLYKTYSDAFPLSYTDTFSTSEACSDIEVIGDIIENQIPIFKLNINESGDNIHSLNIYSSKEQILLSRIMPILENFGLQVIDEHTYAVRPKLAHNVETVWIHNFKIIIPDIKAQDHKVIKGLFENAILDCWLNNIENDTLNKLVISAKLSSRDVSLIRSYAQYIRQTNFPYSLAFISDALYKNYQVVQDFVKLFYAKFYEKNSSKIKSIKRDLEETLSEVDNLSEDAVIRKFIELVDFTLRTNFFQLTEGKEYKDYISLKLRASELTDIPLPKPYAEIFVYSPTMEGVHLRGGSVSRGGLRWSDRIEDFRTEIQGLVKAQMTKNAVIVPVGSKGGFVVKKDLIGCSKDHFMKEGILAYKTFLSGLLDITDNIVNGKVVPPKDVVRYDDDDPYLVVAADKGTASFSDIANEISNKYNFWLGDAFASGGSQGYNHKEMGITAKGAWVSTKRHFYELGKDIEKEAFTVVGIGGMMGDVFGNGMLLSNKLKLVAAFDHMNIFIDPDPDPKVSYKERKRLFELPRSLWSDYDKKLISKGGEIYKRSDKSVTLSKEAQLSLGLKKSVYAPSELIKEILKAPVDLLWNGGIGTYVKSSQENNIEVGDRANDHVRVNACELRCKIIGEGGNLGLTQRGRIEYSLHGGKINTDSVDNSAGVDCSDHEVNIKIVFQKAIEKGLINITDRNKFLQDMTDDVERLVLRDNFLQTQAISIAEFQGVKILEQHDRLMKALEKEGILNRKVEFLPNSDEVAHRHSEGLGLSRPELSVLLAYSKIYLYQSILDSNLPDDNYFHSELIRYFPKQLSEKFLDEIKNHPLRREIISTHVTNSLVNRLGITFFFRLSEDTGLKTCDIARAYVITREAFSLPELWQEIEGLTNKVESAIQIEMFREIAVLIERNTAWFIRNFTQPLSNISKIEKEFKEKIEIIYNHLSDVLTPTAKTLYQERIKYYTSKNVPQKLAKPIASMEFMSSACQIVKVSRGKDIDVDFVAKVYFMIGKRLGFYYLRSQANNLNMDTYWEKLSIKSYIDNLYDQQMRVTDNVITYYLQQDKKLSADKLISNWCNDNKKQVSRFDELITDIQSHDYPDFSMLNVAGTRVKEVGYRYKK